MSTTGIELCDAGFLTAVCGEAEPRLIDVADRAGATDWPGYCYADGGRLAFGREAEDMWFVQPRRVLHSFWARLAHEPSPLQSGAKPPSYSELAFFFLREFTTSLGAATPALDPIVLALPGSYLKDPATEEEKVGLLLGMAGELRLPLAGLFDMACAALCDPRASGFNPALPVIVLDLNLEGADLTLLTTDGRLERKDFIHLPESGFAQLLKHLTGTMGNRFLRHTAFDILEDGRIEQMFFRQTKDFLTGDAAEWQYHINTANRGYEMVAKRDQLGSDSQAFVNGLVKALQSFVQRSPHASEPCTIALTARAGHLPGIRSRLRAAGYSRLLQLPSGAAAAGAACIGASRMTVPEDLADVPVVTSVPLTEARRAPAPQWDARLQKHRSAGPQPAPTHAILDGIGHVIGAKPRYTIGLAELGSDLALPGTFDGVDDCSVPLVHEDGRLWFVDAAPGNTSDGSRTAAARTPIDAGDRLMIHCGKATAEIIFAHCPAPGGKS